MKYFVLLFSLLLLIPLYLKTHYIDTYIINFSGDIGVDRLQSLYHDLSLYGTIYALLTLSYLSSVGAGVGALLRLLALCLITIYLVDYYLITNFISRLTFADSIKYSSYVSNYLSQITQTNWLVSVAGIIYLVLGTLLVIRNFTFKTRKMPALAFTSIAVFMLASTTLSQTNYVHAWIYKNVFEYNAMIMSERRQYSADFIVAEVDDIQTCKPVEQQRKNIIIVMVESLSNYQSKIFSGISDWTPNLDLIASNNSYYKNFNANGFTTEDGELALLKGAYPIYPPRGFTRGGGVSFNGFFGYQNSLAIHLKLHGYHTEFITSSDLEFSNTGAWARSIGFDHVEGHEFEDYNKWQRLQFNAAPDEALYQRLLARIRLNSDKNPYFIFVKTATTHHPFIHPETGQRSEQATFRYADAKLGDFYSSLQQSDFFADGLLIIVGDHHSMVPVRQSEIAKYGELEAAMKVPLVVVGLEDTQVYNAAFQQIDVYNGIKSMVSGETCLTPWRGDAIATAQPADYIIHRPGNNRQKINVLDQQGQMIEVLLDGDATRIANASQPSPSVQTSILNKINGLRIVPQPQPTGLNIAHAGGGILDKTYTNSFEAMNHSLNRGFKLIELDFSWTSDGELVCLHDWQQGFETLYGKKTTTPLTYAEFIALKTRNGAFNACTLTGLRHWLAKHPEVRIVTDIKNDNIAGLRKIAALIPEFEDRIIPQIYLIESLAKVSAMGFKDIIFTLHYLGDSAQDIILQVGEKPLFAITMPINRVKEGLATAFSEKGYRVYTHTINNPTRARILKDFFQVDNIYTDFLEP
ncbi:MAG: sulfatase-like hydrolase/transferase [Pseudomonadales bacterium]|nr:sulfatase-like hydrolase/transferase [Pseudomonadales bacterium]